MPEGTIIRPATEDEKKDFIEIGKPTYQSEFRKKLIEKQQEYVKQHKPFCFRCAKIDFQDRVAEKIKELDRVRGTEEASETLKRIKMPNLDSYGKGDRFKKLDMKDVIEDKLLDGIRTKVTTGYNVIYKCKIRGCGITVFVPKNMYEEREVKK